ncbi:hypothetical protein [Clostridium perfringens]|uniref:hypothetical protein n=1 Tax=Clostridium perfringens TaxID=1502 RepID=UPI0018E49CCB|nr:hypothetical protein [Clostridium perfringens]MBI6036608.1 hypothetical protein [Clostridium perfringens]MDK0596129.1 hypothetical protein [Clostridium perfringens]MDK0943416.1 hypothetical protein [Clostridium perfringens]MDM0648940.1 hypothetical protein [Clostridium perfringens]
MKVYDVKIFCNNDTIRTIKVYDDRIANNCIIIEADKINPTDYSEYIYNKLELKNHYNVFLDLTNIYGFNQKNLYKWELTVENMQIIKENFITLDKINWNSPSFKNLNKFMSNYLNKKIKKLKAI